MDEMLARTQITLPSANVTQSGLDGIAQADGNIEMRKIIFAPLLEIAGTPIQIGALVFMLSQMFDKYERYLAGINPELIVNFRLVGETLVAEILAVLIPDDALCLRVITEFIDADFKRTTPNDEDHDRDHQ